MLRYHNSSHVAGFSCYIWASQHQHSPSVLQLHDGTLHDVLKHKLLAMLSQSGTATAPTPSDLMEDLATAWRKVDGPLTPAPDDSYWVMDYPGVFDLLERLGLSKPKADVQVTAQGVEVPRKPGRPRIRPIIYGPPRPRGHPRKIQPLSQFLPAACGQCTSVSVGANHSRRSAFQS